MKQKVCFNTSNKVQQCSFSNVQEFEKKMRLDINDGSFFKNLLAHDLLGEWTTLSILSKDMKSLFLQMKKCTEDEIKSIQNIIILLTNHILQAMDTAMCVESDIPYEVGVFKITVGLIHDVKQIFSNISGYEKKLPWPDINAITQTISVYIQKA